MNNKYRTIALVLLSGCAQIASATGVQICWDPPTQNSDGAPLSDLAGYRVYYGVAGAPYATCQDVGLMLQAAIVGLAPATMYCFVVTAYSHAGTESALSPSVTWTSPTNAAPAPVVTGINRDGNSGMSVSWSSAAGQVYALERTFRLGDPFQICVSNILATPPYNTVHDVLLTNNAAFYRVLLTP